jgi:hypothetical protein
MAVFVFWNSDHSRFSINVIDLNVGNLTFPETGQRHHFNSHYREGVASFYFCNRLMPLCKAMIASLFRGRLSTRFSVASTRAAGLGSSVQAYLRA